MTNKLKKKIWFFHPTATSPNRNGMHRPHEFSIRLQEDGHDVKVFTSSFLHYERKNVIEDNRLYSEIQEDSVSYVFVKTSSYESNGKDRVMNMLSYYRNMMKTIKHYKSKNDYPDVIIASSPHPLALVAGIRAAKKLKVPSVVEIRDFWPEVFFFNGVIKENSAIGKTLLRGEKWIYDQADAIIFLKEGDVNYLKERKWDTESGGSINIEKSYYINNGVDLEQFDKQLLENDYSDEDLDADLFNVVYTGSIRTVNNIDFLLDTAKLLKDEKNIQFLIFGEGDQKERLIERIQKEEITNVKMKGYVGKKYIPNILNKSSLNILNYSQEKYNWSRGNSSNKLFEYMASGKPIISTVQFGYSQIEKYHCGLSLETNNPQEMADKIMQIYQLPKIAQEDMGMNAREGAKDFDYDELYKKLVKVLKDLKV